MHDFHIERIEDDLWRLDAPYGNFHAWLTSQDVHDLSWKLWDNLVQEGLIEEDDGISDDDFEVYRKTIMRKMKAKR